MTLPDINPSQESQKITTFISDTFKNAGKTTAIVAVSGGIDSAASLLLSTKALGPENILALHLPSKTTNPQNTKDAMTVTKSAGIPEENIITIPIGSMIQKSWKAIKHHSTHTSHLPKGIENRKEKNAPIIKANKLRLANLTARTRMLVLYDQAKRHDALVIGTENMSEHLLGYYTRFGDEASDLEPIRHLYKTQVYKLAKHLEIPQKIIAKAPSADLWNGQTDENELGFSYNDADPILHLHSSGKSKQEIIKKGFDDSLVEKVLKVVTNNSFKQAVPHKI